MTDTKPSEFANRGWVVLALASITAGLTGPGQTIGVSVFIDSFVDDLSLSRNAVSTAYLIGTLAGAALLPHVGRFVDEHGVRVSQALVGVLFAIALINMSAVNGLVWLAIGFAGIRFLGQGSLSLVANVTVAIKFTRQRGLAIGIFATATSVLMALSPVGLNWTINEYGWRKAWIVAAAVVAATVIPIGWFGLRSLPTGARKARAAGTHAPTLDGSFTRSEALRTRSFWVLAAVSGSAGMLATGLNFHQIDLMGESGISKDAAAALFIPQVLGSMIAGLLVGYLSDRVGTRYLPAAGMALLVLTHLLAAVIAPGFVVIVYAIVLGAMAGAVRTATAQLLPTWFGTGHVGSIQGLMTFLTVAASALGPLVLAVTQGGFGSYGPAALLLSTIPAAAMIFSLGEDHHRRPLVVPEPASV